jgi:hypothetical protein
MWYSDIMGRINSLPEMLRQTLQTEGERIVNIVGNTNLIQVHRFAPSFQFVQIFDRFRSDPAEREAEEASRATVAEVVAKL